MTLSIRSPGEAPTVGSSLVARAASGNAITAPMSAPRNDIWKVSRTPADVVRSVVAERSGGNIPETNLSIGMVLVKSLTRSNSVPQALQPVTPRMARTTSVVFQEKRGTAPPIWDGCSVCGDAISALYQPSRFFCTRTYVVSGLGASPGRASSRCVLVCCVDQGEPFFGEPLGRTVEGAAALPQSDHPGKTAGHPHVVQIDQERCAIAVQLE